MKVTATQQPRKRGRPAIHEGGSVVATVRVSMRQAEAMERAALKAKKDTRQWMRDVLAEASAT